MVNKRIRKTSKTSWDQVDMERAFQEVKNLKKSVRSTAKKFCIPFATLLRYVKSGSAQRKLRCYHPVFTSEQEIELLEYIFHMDELFYGLSKKEFLQFVYQYAELNNIKHNFQNGSASRGWYEGFAKRNPHLTLRKPKPTSIARAREFNKAQVYRFFDLLEDQISLHKVDATRLFNMAETRIQSSSNNPPRFLSKASKRQVGLISRGKTTTVVCCCSAAGAFLPPFMIFSRKKIVSRWLDGAPPNTQGTVSDNGCINGPVFLDWLRFFVDIVRPSADKKVILVLDNLESHKYLPALEFARKQNIIFLTFATRITHKIEPLDRCVLRPLEVYFKRSLAIFRKAHAGRITNQNDIARLYREAYVKVATPENAISGFKSCGLWPTNRFIIKETDIMPASVTDNLREIEPRIESDLGEDPEQELPVQDNHSAYYNSKSIEDIDNADKTPSPSVLDQIVQVGSDIEHTRNIEDLHNMGIMSEQSQTDDTIQKMLSMKLDASLNVTVTLLDDEEELEDLRNSNINLTVTNKPKRTYQGVAENKNNKQNIKANNFNEALRMKNSNVNKYNSEQITPLASLSNQVKNITPIYDEHELQNLGNQKNRGKTTNKVKKNNKKTYTRKTKSNKQNINVNSFSETLRKTNSYVLNTSSSFQIFPSPNPSKAIIDPLDIVADNLISYIKMFLLYKSHHVNLDFLENRLNYTKYLYFTLSSHLVNEYILPREHEPVFFHKFVLETLKKSKTGISYVTMYCLVKEMLQWTKQKFNQNVVNNRESYFSNGPHPAASNLTNPVNHNQIYETVSNSNSRCLFTAGSPGQEISININTETLKSLEINSQLNKTPERNMKPSEHDMNPSPQKHIALDKNKSDENYSVNIEAPTVESEFFASQNFLKTTTHNPDQENDAIVPRSSTSRDSGCSSPSNNVLLNQMDENTSIKNTILSELLRCPNDITASNVALSYRVPNLCRVCRRVTDTMCVGCHSQYYCSQKCQDMDWPFHSKYCLLGSAKKKC